MLRNHSKTVLYNFEQKAREYDDFMMTCVPDYVELLEHLIAALPFKKTDEISICDLGSGTGNLTQLLLSSFPNANITCIDISPMMTDMGKAKVKNSNVSFEQADFYEYEFSKSFDVIVSSLALHHLVSDEDKKAFYHKIFGALNNRGVFYNGDVVVCAIDTIEEQYIEKWKQWLRQFHTEQELMEQVIDRYYEEDKPVTIHKHLKWLDEIGFSNIDVIWKKGKTAIFGGQK